MKEGLSSDSMDSEDDVPSEAMLRESLRKGKPIFRIVHRPFYWHDFSIFRLELITSANASI